MRICKNCGNERVDESKQTFIYRDYMGNKWDACLRPVCNKCIDAGYYEDEDGKKRLYLGTNRLNENNSF